ncbi:hypothetical protein J6590_095031, partial [Homalodisca vitripennis]
VSSNVPEELETTIHLTEVSPHTFQFPSCQISKRPKCRTSEVLAKTMMSDISDVGVQRVNVKS